MSDELRRQADRILREVLDADASKRGELARELAGGDRVLLELVHRLLGYAREAEHEATAPALDGALGDRIAAEDLPRDEGLAGTRLGRFQLDKEIGRGGMSEVYAATRADGEFEQRVAIKVLKRGLDTDELVRRFRLEREILARFSHPGISRILDGASTPDGRPYLVMELVEGQPINEYADAKRLTIPQRLRLFREVASVVSAAHRSLIVHRDIKPSNVLVSAAGEVKLLDFGIAKLLDENAESGLTRTSARPLTPAYASPEQITGDPITTATDVYQLGALLYALLTGATPHGPGSQSELGWMRAVLEAQPPRLLDAVRDSGGGLAARAALCSTAPARLRSALGGDLEAIVMKALSKTPRKRYGSVDQFAADLDHHLEGLPVSARQYTALYRALLFARRHRVAVTLTAASLTFLLGFTGLTLVQSSTIAKERDRANREADAARRVARFMSSLFAETDPDKLRAGMVSAPDLLDAGRERLDRELADHPLAQAEIARTMAAVYHKMGREGPAEELYLLALEIRERELGERHPETLRCMSALGILYSGLGRLDEAERLVRRTVQLSREVLGAADPETLGAMNNLGLVLHGRGQLDAAEALFRETLDERTRMLGKDHRETLQSQMNLASVLLQGGRAAEALPMLQGVVDGYRRSVGPESRLALDAQFNLSLALSALDRGAEALSLLENVAETASRVLGKSHPTTLRATAGFGKALRRVGRLDEAHGLALGLWQTHLEAKEPAHPRTILAREEVAIIERVRGRLAEARGHFEEMYTGAHAGLGSAHPLTLRCLYNLATMEALTGERDLALEHLQEAVDLGFAAPSAVGDPDWQSLEEDPRYVAAIEAMRVRIESP